MTSNGRLPFNTPSEDLPSEDFPSEDSPSEDSPFPPFHQEVFKPSQEDKNIIFPRYRNLGKIEAFKSD